MTDEKGPRNRQGKGRRKPPSLTVTHDEPVKAGNNTFSTVVRINTSGWWEGGRPTHARLMEEDEGPFAVEIVDGEGSHPLIGLEPGSHHKIVVAINGREVRHLVTVPALPKPEQRKPKRLRAIWTGSDGEYAVTFTVLDADGHPVPKTRLQLVPNGDDNASRYVSTGNGGACRTTVRVPPGEHWFFRALVPGHDVTPSIMWLKGA